MLPLNELFAEWHKIYSAMLERGFSSEEALHQVSRLMLGDAPE